MTGLAGDPSSLVHRLDARAKLLGLLALSAVAAATPRGAWAPLVAIAAVVLAAAVAARIPAGTVARRAAVVAPVLSLLVLIPFVRHGGAQHALGPFTVHDQGLLVAGSAAAKAAIGTLGAIVLGATTTVPAALAALERLRVPRLLVLIAGTTWRYLFVLGDETQRMRAGLAARGHRPRHLLHAGPTGRLAAALFLRAHARGERVHAAMLARGWSGV